MDRSFLIKDEVIKASRDFVCIRLATYEDKEEARFCEKLYRGRSGKLENTVFCFLAPDGKTRLSRAGRGPHSFRNAKDMASQMDLVAMSYAGNMEKKQSSKSKPALPVTKNFRLGLNIASCDLLPCVVISGKDKKEVAAMKESLGDIAWDSKVMGRFVFCHTTDSKELKSISGLKSTDGIFVISPGTYGLKGKVLAEFKSDEDKDKIKNKLIEVADSFVATTKSHRQHVAQGARQGINWFTEVPVTDPGSQQATKRIERIRQQSKGRRK